MSRRWTLPVDDEAPTCVNGEEPEERTLLIGHSAARNRRRPWVSLSGLSRIHRQRWFLFLAIMVGAAAGFLAASSLHAGGPDDAIGRGLCPERCDPDEAVKHRARLVDTPASKPVRESRSASFGEGLMARQAADLVVANRYREALEMYRRLAEHRPDEAVFDHLSSVLKAKLRCGRSHPTGGGACD